MGKKKKVIPHAERIYWNVGANPANWRSTPRGGYINVGEQDFSLVPSMEEVGTPEQFTENAKTIRLISGNQDQRLRGAPNDPTENFIAKGWNTKGYVNTDDWGPEFGPALKRDRRGKFPQEAKEAIETNVMRYKTHEQARLLTEYMMRSPYGRTPRAARVTHSPRLSAGKQKVTTTFEPMIASEGQQREGARVRALNKGLISTTQFMGGAMASGLGMLGRAPR